MNGLNNDTSIRLRRETKDLLSELDFVKKDHSYHDIIVELINFYNKKSGKR